MARHDWILCEVGVYRVICATEPLWERGKRSSFIRFRSVEQQDGAMDWYGTVQVRAQQRAVDRCAAVAAALYAHMMHCGGDDSMIEWPRHTTHIFGLAFAARP